jgi:hypothetical protein
VTLWDYPALVVLAAAGALAVAAGLLRAGNPARSGPPDFECAVCGRRQRSRYARDWRYCPFCGAEVQRPPPRY